MWNTVTQNPIIQTFLSSQNGSCMAMERALILSHSYSSFLLLCGLCVYIVTLVEYFLSRYCSSYFPVLWFLWYSSHLLSYSSDLQISPLKLSGMLPDRIFLAFSLYCHYSFVMYIFSSP